MLFYLSKIIWPLLAPLNAICLLVGLGVLVRFVCKKTGSFLIGLALFLFLMLGILPVGHNALVYLESLYAQPEDMPKDIDGILTLGGAFSMTTSEVRNVQALNSSAERITETMILGREYPNAMVVFSGGNGLLLGARLAEADLTEQLLERLGYPLASVAFEDESRNTYENIVFSKQHLRPFKGETWVLVTSAYHMRRAMAVAKSEGWGVIPYPVDYRTDGQYRIWPDSFNVTRNFRELELAIREMVGVFVYRITGKISLPD